MIEFVPTLCVTKKNGAIFELLTVYARALMVSSNTPLPFPKFDVKNLIQIPRLLSLDLDRDLCDRGIPIAWPRADLDLHEIVVDCDLVADPI